MLTFEPPPRQVFQPDLPPFRLTPLRIKARALEALGVDNMIVLHFDLAFSKLSAESFVKDILCRDLVARHIVTGWDFRFMAGDSQLAHVSKKWSGMGKELFTSADNYILQIDDSVPADNPVRILILAAVLCIDMVLKE